jgi:hypothetical protein
MIKKIPEREIIESSPKRRPYGAKLTLLLEKHTHFPIKGECALLVSPKIILRIAHAKEHDELENQNKWDIFVEGFPTAGEAEQAGLKVALGFLWSAISGSYGARLIYHTPLPCTVYNRNNSRGLHFSGHATSSFIKGINGVVDPVNQVVSLTAPVDQKLLLASELFASARLETTERAKFIGLVSSLEPLTHRKNYDSEVLRSLIKDFTIKIKKSNFEEDMQNSLCGRIDQLNFESILSSIRRLIEETLPEDLEAIQKVQEAYSLRSKILHEGSTDADLDLKSNEIQDVIRRIIEAKINSYL